MLAAFAAARLLSARLAVASAVAATVGLWPKFDLVASSLTNDALAQTLTAVALVMLLLWLRGRRSLLWATGLGVALGLGAITKFTVLPIASVLLAVLILVAVQRRDWRGPAVAVAACLTVSGWWFIREIVNYGDPLATAATRAYLSHVLPGLVPAVPSIFRMVPFTGMTALRFAASIVNHSVWWDGGWNQLLLPAPLNLAISSLAIVSLVAGGWMLVRRPWGATNRLASAAAVFGTTLGSVVGLLLIVRETNQAEGRYLLVAIPAWAVLLVAGTNRLRCLSRRLGAAVFWAWPVLFAAVNLVVYVTFVSQYHSL